MDVILLTKVANLGNIGDRVTVKSGYGRNFLLPSGKATLATAANIAKFEARRAELEKLAREQFADAERRAAALKEFTLRITAKAGSEGKLFGSIGTTDIAEACTAQGHKVARSEVRLPNGPIRMVGDHQVVLHLHTDIDVQLAVTVAAEEGGIVAELLVREGDAVEAGAVLARLEQFASENEATDPGDLVDAYLRSRLRTRPFVDVACEKRCLLFLGPPGAGKTTTIAKAAATLVAAGKRVMLVSLEKDRLGGDSQLEHLAGLLSLPLVSVEKAQRVNAALRGAGRVDCILADAPSIHPWRVMDVDESLSLAERLSAAPVMVVPAGLEARETADSLATIRGCGVEHAIVTKCDVTRRLGTLLNALIIERFVVVGLQQSRSLNEKLSASDPNLLKLAFNLQS